MNSVNVKLIDFFVKQTDYLFLLVWLANRLYIWVTHRLLIHLPKGKGKFSRLHQLKKVPLHQHFFVFLSFFVSLSLSSFSDVYSVSFVFWLCLPTSDGSHDGLLAWIWLLSFSAWALCHTYTAVGLKSYCFTLLFFFMFWPQWISEPSQKSVHVHKIMDSWKLLYWAMA